MKVSASDGTSIDKMMGMSAKSISRFRYDKTPADCERGWDGTKRHMAMGSS